MSDIAVAGGQMNLGDGEEVAGLENVDAALNQAVEMVARAL